MTTPHPTCFPVTTPRAGVFAPLVIISDSDNEITTLPVRPTPSPDYIPALYGYPLDSGDNSSDVRLLSHSTPRLLHRYRETMNRWRAASPSTCHPLLSSEIPLLSSPPSLLTSSSSPPSLLLPSSSRKRSRSPSPSLVLPSPPPTVVPLPPEDIESIGDDIKTLHASLASAMQETMTLRARVGSLKQHDVVPRESLRIARGMFIRSQL
ncbi:hypothetical protein Tco_1547585 [Tanacetum coccineum]